jgi:two-component system, NarL family, nitrate/nitrite response regulator NarL
VASVVERSVESAQAGPIDPAVELAVEELLRQLIEYVGGDAYASAAPSEQVRSEEVLLDVHIDGRRYVLARAQRPATEPRASLSPREKEIVRLVAKGLPNKAIADLLDISLWTVATYLRRLFSKLAVNSRAELVARAYGEGFLG